MRAAQEELFSKQTEKKQSQEEIDLIRNATTKKKLGLFKTVKNSKTSNYFVCYTCEKCGRMMVIKYGRFGKFLACPGYPECKNTKPLAKDGTSAAPEKEEETETDVVFGEVCKYAYIKSKSVNSVVFKTYG